jgi:CubicO group peptidase (beta-lactamase class C family)
MHPRVALFMLAVLGCGSDPPPWQWPESTPAEQGMDATVMEGARTYAFQEGKNTQGVVVIRHGTLVAEWYEDGRDATSYAASWSVAKSFASALIGIAIDEGKIPGVDVKLVNYYSQWEGSPRDQISLAHLLHMSSGLEWTESYATLNADESDVIGLVFTTDSPLDYVLGKPLESPPGTVWEYSSGDTLLESGVIEQATGMTAGEYAEARIFSKLGIPAAQWWQASTGETLTYCCLDMPSRDFARFGQLYLQNGMWEGEQIVPAAWVAASQEPSIYEGYGYQWWLAGRTDSGLPADTYMADGFDGQYIYVVPSLDLVVVRNGHYDKDIGPPIADPTLFLRYPPGGYTAGAGTLPPDSWSNSEFLQPIIASITD